MNDVVLVQPSAGGRISGGYLYNERMAAHGAWRVVEVGEHDLSSLGSVLSGASLVLADSIWLSETHASFFLELQKRGLAVGVMLHSFPSMIRAAEAGEEPRTEPTPFEIETLERLGLLVTLGEHYPNMLAGRAVRVVLAPPGVDPEWRRAPRHRRGRLKIVSVGGVTPRKGFLDAARALSGYRADDFEWHVVGSLDADPSYARRVQAATQPASSAHLLGQLPPERTREVVLDADLLLMPSYDENHPLTLVEALAASVPAVAYRAGASESIVGHERCGLLSPIGDVRMLREHLGRVLSDEDLRFGFAEACFARRAELPSWERAASQARARLVL